MRIEGIAPDAVHAYFDKRGFATLTIDGLDAPMFTAAFEADIQTRSAATLIYELLDDVTSGRKQTTNFSGNSCTVGISRDQVTIENDILEDQQLFAMSTQQYRTILDAWSSFLAQPG